MPVNLSHRLTHAALISALLGSAMAAGTPARSDDLFLSYEMGGYYNPSGNYNVTVADGAVAEFPFASPPNPLPPLLVTDGSGPLYLPQIPGTMAFGPDGTLYIASDVMPYHTATILKYNGATGAYMGTAISGGAAEGSNFGNMVFNNGYLYARYTDPSGSSGSTIWKIDPSTGKLVQTYDCGGFDGLSGGGLCNMPNGDLLWLNLGGGNLVELNPATGNSTVFADLPGSGGAFGADLTPGPDGTYFVLDGSKLYTVSSTGGNAIQLGSYTSGSMKSLIFYDDVLYATDEDISTNLNGVVDEFNPDTGALVSQTLTGDAINGGFAIESFDNITGTPEPGSVGLLIGLGITATALVRRGRRRK